MTKRNPMEPEEMVGALMLGAVVLAVVLSGAFLFKVWNECQMTKEYHAQAAAGERQALALERIANGMRDGLYITDDTVAFLRQWEGKRKAALLQVRSQDESCTGRVARGLPCLDVSRLRKPSASKKFNQDGCGWMMPTGPGKWKGTCDGKEIEFVQGLKLAPVTTLGIPAPFELPAPTMSVIHPICTPDVCPSMPTLGGAAVPEAR